MKFNSLRGPGSVSSVFALFSLIFVIAAPANAQRSRTVVRTSNSLTSPSTTTPTFAAPITYTTSSTPVALAAADLNGDGRDDVVVAQQTNNNVAVRLNTGGGALGVATTYGTGTGPVDVKIADLNGDGRPDLVVANSTANTVSVLLNIGNGTFGTRTDYTTGTKPFALAIGDLNGDGAADVITANQTANGVSVLFGVGNGTLLPKADYSTGTGPTSLTLGDFNADGSLDMAVANYGNNSGSTLSIFLNPGTGIFTGSTTQGTGVGPRYVMAGDVNRDGKLDLVNTDANQNTVSVHIGNGNGTFQTKSAYQAGGGPITLFLGDLNLDGQPDISVTATVTRQITAVLGTGGSSFTATPSQVASTSGGQMVINDDLDGDGKRDVIFTDTSTGLNVLINTTPFPPTAADVTVSGRILSATGLGIRGASISMTDSRGHILRAVSNSFGYYTFESVPAGDNYVVNASSRGFTFAPKVVKAVDALTGIDIIAQ